MGFQQDTVLRRIRNCTPEALTFINEWFDDSPSITAHTSGSTGTPKEIHLLKSDMIASAESTNSYFGITGRSTLLCPLSAGYIAGKMMIVRAIIAGATLYMETPTNRPVHNDYGMVDLIAVVPSQIPHLLENVNIFGKLRKILIGGAQLAPELSEKLVNSKADAYVSYGMTETCSHVAIRKIASADNGEYEAMPDISFGTDERGCLVIIAENRSFRKLHTNDIAELTDDRHFIWKGRLDNVINSGGIKVYPEEIEQLIRNVIPESVEYYIGKQQDEKWGEIPVLVISQDIKEKEDLLSKVRASVKSNAQRPSKIIVDDIKHTVSGKIIRRPASD